MRDTHNFILSVSVGMIVASFITTTLFFIYLYNHAEREEKKINYIYEMVESAEKLPCN